MSGLPIEVSLSEFAEMSGLTRKAVCYRAERGGLPVRRVTGNARGKRVILLSALQAVAPDLWTSLVLRCQLSSEAA